MGRTAPEPLTLEQAKAKLRAVAAESQVSAIESIGTRKPLLLALGAGVLLGSGPESRHALARILAELLLTD